MPGRPILYGTSDNFLRQFGLQDLKELPSLDFFGGDVVEEAAIEAEEEVDENNIEK